MEHITTEVLVIGAGPGGYPAAIRAAQLGNKVVVVERGEPGGVCLNVGCIPSKTLIDAAHQYELMQQSMFRGIKGGNSQLDIGVLQRWKDGVVNKFRDGVRILLDLNGCKYVKGAAHFVNARTVKIDGNNEVDTITFEDCIIATGSRPIEIPNFSFDDSEIVDSTGALHFSEVPKSLCVIGGGVIGLELGMAWAKLGAKLTIIEMTDELLPGTDRDLVSVVVRKLLKMHAEIHTNSRAVRWDFIQNDDFGISIESSTGERSVTCEKILVAVGRKPNTDNLGLETLGIKMDSRGFIEAREQDGYAYVPGIYAVGDIVAGPMLAHRATFMGEGAASTIINPFRFRDHVVIPAVTFTDPEIASVGLTETQAVASGIAVRVGRCPFAVNGRALTSGNTEGFVKVLIGFNGRHNDGILGVHMVGAGVGELIGEAVLAVNRHLSAREIVGTIHAHPTRSEAFVEAVRAAIGEPLHTLPTKKK